MKMHLIKTCSLIVVFLLALSIAAQAETYPVYEVTVRPAFLRSSPGFPDGASGDDYGNILAGIQEHALVLVAKEENGWCLVMTQEQLVGYIEADYLSKIGREHRIDEAITDEKVSNSEEINIQYITVDPQAILPTDRDAAVELPATIIRKEPAYDEKVLLTLLLGEDYEYKQRGDYDNADDYVSRAADKQDRCVFIDIETGSFSYHDGMVADEREDGYVPPLMKMPREESLALCRALLGNVFPNEWLKHIGIERTLLDRWNSEEERWLTEGEYSTFLRSDVVHYHLFEHRYDNGVKILDDELLAAVGVNGLSMFEINWHDFEVANANNIIPMPLEEAVSMANSTRLGPAVLLGAELAYSNRITGDNRYNICWFLITSSGNYIVDCVLNRHKCDSYEY